MTHKPFEEAMPHEWKRNGVLALITSACTLLQILKVVLHWRIDGLGIPISFGLLKDLIDAAFVFLIPWGGWPAAVTEVAGRILKVDFKYRALYSLFSAYIVGHASAYFSFENASAGQITRSVATSIFIFAVVLLVTSIASILLRKITSRL